MSNEEMIKAVEQWQAEPMVHPLTCGVDSQNHRPLFATYARQGVILKCPDCNYAQTYIPEIVFIFYEGNNPKP